MRILVYGAGVLGCELAHELCKGSNEVTLLARGKWKKTIDEKGLVIRHYVQLHTTKEKIRTIDHLKETDIYDCIFVVMQYIQVKEILPILAANHSPYLILVGNNMEPEYCMKEILKNSQVKKEIAFGFQGTAGRREKERVVSIHVNTGMTIGGLRSNLSSEFEQCLNKVVAGTGYRLTKENQMEGWLISHLAFILPISYLCYSLDCNLKRASRQQIEMIFDAVAEAHEMMKKLGIPIRPDGEEEYFIQGRKKNAKMLYLMAKTPFGKLAASDHCRNAVAEMQALDAAFEKIKTEAGVCMPTWDRLRADGKAYFG